MSDVAFYYPPVYQQSPAGNQDYLGPSHDEQSGGTGNGVVGKDGATIINGTGAPVDTQGKPDDLYYQLDGAVLWGPKTGNGWGSSGIELVGKAGVNGSRIYRVAAIPGSASGYADGDILIDDDGNLAQVINS